MEEPKKTGRILFVEDDQSVMRSYQMVLRKTNYEYEIARNGKDTIKLLEANPKFNVIFLDQRIEGDMQGSDLLRDFIEMPDVKLIPIVFCTAQLPLFTMRLFPFESPIVYYLKKPFMKQPFLDILERVITRKNLGELRRELIKEMIEHKGMTKLYTVDTFKKYFYFD